jgi:hypothetical protein
MNNNCYYIAGKNATFNDNRPTSRLSNATLAAWKTHISGETGTIEVNPNLNANYMPTNAQCAGMGIQNPFTISTGIHMPQLVTGTLVTIHNGMLWIENQVAETVQGYSITGALLFSFQKPEGSVLYPINQPNAAMLIIRGSSGWAKKIMSR